MSQIFIKQKQKDGSVVEKWIDFDGKIPLKDIGFITNKADKEGYIYTWCPTLDFDGWELVVPQPIKQYK